MWGGRGGGIRKSIWGRGGMGCGGAGGGGFKNKFGLKCCLDDFKCYKAYFFSFLFFSGKSTHPLIFFGLF